ncbi:MAG: peptidase M16 [Chitinophagales bacterium]|nr:MAG: peptidase M16 [Chitinophagales bacterium]
MEPPPIRRIERIQLKPAEQLLLSNSIPVYLLNQGVHDVSMVLVSFAAGKWMQETKLVARFTNRMLPEGSVSYTSLQIAEKLDYLGATLKTHCGPDRAHIYLSSLNKHLPETLPLLAELIRQPVFPEAELEVLLTRSRERLKVDKTRHDYVASRRFTSALYGEQHPYGSTHSEEDFDKVTTDLLRQFYNQHYHAGNCYIIAAGKIADNTLKRIEQLFGDPGWKKPPSIVLQRVPQPDAERKQHIPMPKSVQSALRIGKRLFNKCHPDFMKMQVLNTVLGGYFGSRLMSNIREDKGFTYGIHSALLSLLQDGYFYIATEVGYESTRQASAEIYREIKRLQEELIPDDELDLVRNYLSGKILSGLDGPFRQAEYYNGLIPYGLGIDYVQRLMDTIRTVTADELRELARNYLDTETLYEIVAG